MDDQRLDTNTDVASKKKHYIVHAFTLIIYLVFLALISPVVLFFAVDKEDRMPKDIGYIHQYAYNRYVDDSMESQVTFDLVSSFKWTFLDINDVTYRSMYSSNNLFFIGMMNESFLINSIEFETFDFLYGRAFEFGDEIVLTKNISIDLFDTINSVDQTIEINEITYTVVGIVDNFENLGEYIFFSEENIDMLDDDVFFYDSGYAFKDDDLHLKLYQLGGYDLAARTLTYLQQGNTMFVKRMIVNFLLLCVILIGFLFNKKNLVYKITKEERIKQLSEQSMIPLLLKTTLVTTLFIGFMILHTILVMSNEISLRASREVVLDFLIKYPYIFMIYALPIIYTTISKLRVRKL